MLARQVLAIVLLAVFVLGVTTLVYVGRLATLIWQDTCSSGALNCPSEADEPGSDPSGKASGN